MTEDFQLLISEEAISKKIASFAQILNQKFQGQQLHIIMILKGSLCFVADLIRKLDIAFTIDAISCSSYGQKGTSRGTLSIEGLNQIDVKGHDVLLVDDIFDTGFTLATVAKLIQDKEPRSLATAVLLDKPAKKQVDFAPDYTLFSVEDRFVIGYGLDYKELYRGLPGIYEFKELL
jgi:hypoxanthine phosphoribosyltransferase